jgi:hypothetical protein
MSHVAHFLSSGFSIRYKRAPISDAFDRCFYKTMGSWQLDGESTNYFTLLTNGSDTAQKNSVYCLVSY